MRILIWALGIALCGALLLGGSDAALLAIQQYRKADASLWFDEISTTQPVLSVMENGYTGFRCVSEPRFICYGGTLPIIEGLVLRKTPPESLGTRLIAAGPGFPWLSELRDPDLGVWMRDWRVISGGLILLFLSLAAWRVHSLLALSVFSALLMSSAFVASWNGIKNDFPNALAGIGFYILVFRIARLERWETRRWGLRLLVVLGVALGFIKLSGLPLAVASIGVLAVGEFFRKTPVRVLGVELVRLGGLAVLTFCFFHPSLLSQTEETRWIKRVLDHNSNLSRLETATAEQLWRERQLALETVWPFLMAGLVLLWQRLKNRAPIGLGFLLGFTGCLLGTVGALKANFTGLYNRPHYYLPIYCAGLWLMVRVLRDCMPADPVRRLTYTRLASMGVALATLGTVLSNGRMSIYTLKGFDPQGLVARWHAELFDPVETDLSRFGSTRSRDRIYLDVQARWPIPQALLDSGVEVRSFDSLSESPHELASRIELEAQGVAPDAVSVVAPCWEFSEKDRGVAYAENPVIEQWLPLTGPLCVQKSPYGFRVLAAHSYAERAVAAQKVEFARFKAALPRSGTAIGLPEGVFHPRLFSGSIAGADDVDNHGRVQFYDRSLVMRRRFKSPKEARTYRFQITSSCKNWNDEPNFVEMRVNGQTQTRVEIKTRDLFCEYYAERLRFDVCSYAWPLSHLKSWSQKPLPVGDVLLSIPGSARSKRTQDSMIEVELEVRVPNETGCKVYVRAGDRELDS